MEIINRKVKFDYFIEEEYEAGIVLTGTEIKSIRKGSCNIKDCYGIIRHGEIYLLNMFIGQYKEGNILVVIVSSANLCAKPVASVENQGFAIHSRLCRAKKVIDRQGAKKTVFRLCTEKFCTINRQCG